MLNDATARTGLTSYVRSSTDERDKVRALFVTDLGRNGAAAMSDYAEAMVQSEFYVDFWHGVLNAFEVNGLEAAVMWGDKMIMSVLTGQTDGLNNVYRMIDAARRQAAANAHRLLGVFRA